MIPHLSTHKQNNCSYKRVTCVHAFDLLVVFLPLFFLSSCSWSFGFSSTTSFRRLPNPKQIQYNGPPKHLTNHHTPRGGAAVPRPRPHQPHDVPLQLPRFAKPGRRNHRHLYRNGGVARLPRLGAETRQRELRYYSQRHPFRDRPRRRLSWILRDRFEKNQNPGGRPPRPTPAAGHRLDRRNVFGLVRRDRECEEHSGSFSMDHVRFCVLRLPLLPSPRPTPSFSS